MCPDGFGFGSRSDLANIQQRSTGELTRTPSSVCKARNTTSLVYFPVWVSWAQSVLGTAIRGSKDNSVSGAKQTAHRHTHAHTHIHTYIYIYTHTYTFTYMYKYVYTYIYIYLSLSLSFSHSLSNCVYTYTCTCAIHNDYTYVYIYIHTHTQRLDPTSHVVSAARL